MHQQIELAFEILECPYKAPEQKEEAVQFLRLHVSQLEVLVSDMAATIEDMMSSTGGAFIVQNYARLNDVLLRQRRLVPESVDDSATIAQDLAAYATLLQEGQDR